MRRPWEHTNLFPGICFPRFFPLFLNSIIARCSPPGFPIELCNSKRFEVFFLGSKVYQYLLHSYMSHLCPSLRKQHYRSLWKPCQKMNNKEFWFDVSMGEGFISAVCRGVWHLSSMELLCLQVLFLCTILAYAQLHLLFSIRDIIIFLPRQCLVGSVPYFSPNLELGMSLNFILLSPTFCWPNTQRSPRE